MTEHHPEGGVRVTNAEIYRLLLEANGRVSSVQQTMEQVVMPSLRSHSEAIDRKADKATVAEQGAELSRVRMQVYAITSGLVAAALGANQLGLL